MACKSVQRTLAALRKLGYTAEVTEKWIPFFGKGNEDNPKRGVRRDLLNFIDIIAIGKPKILAVQACDLSTRKLHIKKILNEPNALKWLRSGGQIEVWAWRKLKKKNKDGRLSKVAKYEAKVFLILPCHTCLGWYTETVRDSEGCLKCNGTGICVEEKSDD